MLCMKYYGLVSNGLGKVPFQAAQYSRVISQSLQQKLGLPERPKRPMTPFLKYTVEQRPSILKENPNLKPREIIKKLSSSWNQLDTSVKTPMQQEYKSKFAQYMEENRKYNESLSKEKLDEIQKALQDAKTKRLEKRIKDEKKHLGQPKRPPTTFSLFLKDKLTESGQKSTRELLKKMSDEWKNSTEKVKQQYNTKYEEQKEKYIKDMEEWEKKMVKAGRADLVRQNSAALDKQTVPRTKHGSKEGAHLSEKSAKGRGKKTVEKV